MSQTGERDVREGVRIHVVDAGGTERELTLADIPELELSDDQVLWIDALADHAEELRDAVDHLCGPAAGQAGVPRPTGKVAVADAEDLLRVEVVAVGADDEPAPVSCLVGTNWLLTVHEEPLDFEADFRERMSGGSELGRLDAVTFLGTLLGWQVRSYGRAVAALSSDIDELDTSLLATDVQSDDALAQLVALRRRIGALRKMLLPHRDAFASLASPELDRISTSESAATFRRLATEVAEAADAVDSAREMLLGSFEILMTRSAQRTNETMATLTIVTVVLLPSTLLAGIMGMNFHPAFFDHAALFWVTLGVMAAAMAGTVTLLRRRLQI